VGSPRIAILADDLIWATRLAALARSAGAEPVAIRSVPALAAVLGDGVDRAIVDLTARAYDGVEAVGAAASAGAAVLAVGQHDDAPLRRRARAAGAGRVVPYRTLAMPSAVGVLSRWLAATPGATSGVVPTPEPVR
jgi:hypothetical protein